MPHVSCVRHRFAVAAFVALCAGALIAVPQASYAQFRTKKSTESTVDTGPIILINVASIERVLQEMDFTFEAAGRPELSETLGGLLARVNDLKGLDRNQSVGVMFFLNGITFDVVGYVPVKDLEELLKTLDGGPVAIKKVDENRFELLLRAQTLYARVVNDYAFVANDAEALDRDFSDPVTLTNRLSTAYDIAASINLRSVPEATRELFLNFLRTQTEIDLQRRDDEPEPAHRVRKAFGMRNLAEIETLVHDGQEITVGWKVSAEERNAVLEVTFAAVAGTEFADYLNELHGTRSHFANLLKEYTPLTASVSLKLTKPTAKLLAEVFAAAEAQMTGDLQKAGTLTEESNPVADLFRVLKDTAGRGRLDGVLQFVGQPPQPFAFIGGVRVTDSPALASALEQVVDKLKGNANLSEVKVNAFSHREIAFHRIESARMNPGEEKLYGGKPAFYIGAGDGTFWFAVGGDRATTALKSAMDKVAEPPDENYGTLPAQLVINISNWMHLMGGENPSPTSSAGIAREAFGKGHDALRIDIRPFQDGAKLHIELDEAFLRFLGKQMARRFDRQ